MLFALSLLPYSLRFKLSAYAFRFELSALDFSL